ncbi:ATP-binding protein [Streptomyces sp. SRF1]|uniref:ATP-binding protein n=1 Tax=Streptomyces sp. SRF1 TaxID=1549642 RepID=UPI0025B09934|nr:ATP-binding protein [Streptomyces sp. SRF1]MDN3056773.1 ATP-binding protein [Streptomyces sp. SRF1]
MVSGRGGEGISPPQASRLVGPLVVAGVGDERGAALIIAELAANAALHGRVPGRNFRLTLTVTGPTLRIEVRDPRVERLPTVRPAPEPDAPRECGHGLLLVEELADRWGIVPELIGKTVRAEIGT